MRPSANEWIDKLRLAAHIEGGAFREIYRSGILLSERTLTNDFTGSRNLSTSIYFLLKEKQFSAFHRIKSDEQWHFYFGDDLIIYEIEPGGEMIKHILGNNPDSPAGFTCVVKAGNWFASACAEGGEYAIAGCTVAPGFDYSDFELAGRNHLIALFPQHKEIITRLTARDK